MAAAVPRPNVQHPQRVPLGGLPAVWLCISRIEAGVVNAVDPLRTMDGDPPRRRRFAPSRVGESACVRSFASRLKSVRVATMGFSRKFELCQPYYPVQRFKHVVCGGRSSSHKALVRKRCTGSAVCTEPSRARKSNSWSRSRRSNRRTGRSIPTTLALSEIGFCTIRRSCRNKRSVPVPFEELTASGGLQDISEFRSKPFLRNGLQVVSRMT
jgi:hypothetical protein